MSIDPRMAARRHEVREVAARADARRTLRWLAAIGIVVALVWVAQGPLFSITEVRVTGAERVDPTTALVAGGIEVGRPITLVRTSAAIEALGEDPWVAAAEIHVVYRHLVTLTVLERVPAAEIRSDVGTYVVATDGVVVARGDGGGGLPVADIPAAGAGTPGLPAPLDAAAAAAFLAALPTDLAHQGTVGIEQGELWFDVGEVRVRLGRPAEMEDKALVLEALLADGVPPGATIHLVTPRRPAVEAPPGLDTDDDAEPEGGG